MNFLIAYHLSAFETTDGIHIDWVDHGIETIVTAEVSSQAEALRRFLKDYEGYSNTRVQIVSITKLEEETDKMFMAWCYNHWAQEDNQWREDCKDEPSRAEIAHKLATLIEGARMFINNDVDAKTKEFADYFAKYIHWMRD